jgi:hypothetical protein
MLDCICNFPLLEYVNMFPWRSLDADAKVK